MESQAAFKKTQAPFMAELVLKNPDPNGSFVIQADANYVGVVFLQKNEQWVL